MADTENQIEYLNKDFLLSFRLVVRGTGAYKHWTPRQSSVPVMVCRNFPLLRHGVRHLRNVGQVSESLRRQAAQLVRKADVAAEKEQGEQHVQKRQM